MPDSSSRDADVEAIFARLREEVRAGPGRRPSRDEPDPIRLQSRRELDRLWAVTAERPYLSRPGGWGRLRALLLLPAKWVLRKLMRWYVEPVATDQRAFNAAVMRAFDEQLEWMRAEFDRLERSQRSASPAADE
jgi:hypothetical protein